MRFLPLISVTSTAFGGHRYTYAASDGRTYSITTPGPHFDSRRATKAELEAAGVPPEPTPTSPEYPKWRAMIDNGIHFVSAPQALATLVQPKPLPSGMSAENLEQSENWAGYIAEEGHNSYIREAVFYREPAEAKSSCEKTEETATAIWGGLGGAEDSELLGQDGTIIGSAFATEENVSWFEVLPSNLTTFAEAHETPLSATPGAFMEAQTEYNKATGVYSFYEYNFATETATHAEAKGGFEGNQAEGVVERPLHVKGPAYALAAAEQVQMQTFVNGYGIDDYNPTRSLMYGRNKTLDEYPSHFISHSEYFDVYQNCEAGLDEEELKARRESEVRASPPVAPAASTSGASEETSSTAVAAADVNPEGSSTTYTFEYGTESGNYGASTAPSSAGAGLTEAPVTSTLTGLSAGTTYYFRVVAHNYAGSSIGTQKTFKTTGSPPPPPPTVTAVTASKLTAHAATLEATINPNGLDTHYYFEYGKEPGLYEGQTPVPPGTDIGSGKAGVAVSVPVSHLLANTTYYYRAVASNSSGTTYTPESEFHTKWAWQIQTTVNPKGTTERDELAGVSCWATTGCIAVGSQVDSEGKIAPLAERWNGTEWTLQSAANPASVEGAVLEAVSCTSASECTATGYYEASRGDHYSLAERWNGTTWAVQSTPTYGSDTTLDGVSCASSKECVAVGWDLEESTLAVVPAIEKWNGKAWSTEKAAKLPKEDHEVLFWGVSCPAAKKCEAVGAYDHGTEGGLPLAESMASSKWTAQTVPTQEHMEDAELRSVSCSSPSACTAVGSVENTTFHKQQSFAARWNGTEWALQTGWNPLADPEYESEASWELSSVSCPESGACMAVGKYSEGSKGASGLLGEYWNGASWTGELPENRTGVERNVLSGVSCGSGTVCTSVGFSEVSVSTTHTLAEQLTEP